MFKFLFVGMATTFQFPKPMEEVSDPVILPKDWYDIEILREPVIRPNNVLKEAVGESPDDEIILAALESEDKAGFNLVINVAVEHPDERYAGMDFPIYLPFPSAVDENKYSKGQKKSDAKMQRIERAVVAFGGTINGSEFVLEKGMKACAFIDTRKVGETEQLENFVDVFNAGLKPYQG